MRSNVAALFASIAVHAVLIAVLLALRSDRTENAAIAHASNAQPIEIAIVTLPPRSTRESRGVVASEASKSPVRVRASKRGRAASKGNAEATSSSGSNQPGIVPSEREPSKERALDLKLRSDFELGTATEAPIGSAEREVEKRSNSIAPTEG